MPLRRRRGLPVRIFMVEMAQKRRTKAAWSSYLGIQALWLVCVILAPLAFGSYPSKYWAMPLCLVTVAGGLHLVFFRREYDEILRKAVRLFPFARQPTLAQRDPRYILPLGIAYTLFGVASALLVIFA